MTPPAARNGWFDRVWPVVAASTGVGYVALSYVVARWLTRSYPESIVAPAELKSYMLSDLECATTDGMRLKGWALSPSHPRANVVLFHGMRRNRLDMVSRVLMFANAGYRCILFDHRGHGESDGDLTSFGYHERHDVAAVATLVRQAWPALPCAALGVSMGAAAVCFAAGDSHVFDAVVLESLYHDLDRAFDHRVGGEFPEWFTTFRLGITWFIEQRMGAPLHEVSPAVHIAKLAPTPILLVTGSEDAHAPPTDAHGIAKQASSAQVCIIDGACHSNVLEYGGARYERAVLSFLDQHLFASRPSYFAA
jgi:alpha-beta hydrolase superfamily lysophospholipase